MIDDRDLCLGVPGFVHHHQHHQRHTSTLMLSLHYGFELDNLQQHVSLVASQHRTKRDVCYLVHQTLVDQQSSSSDVSLRCLLCSTALQKLEPPSEASDDRVCDRHSTCKHYC
jgi:hypothetical protein